jgi:hypothetical protein
MDGGRRIVETAVSYLSPSAAATMLRRMHVQVNGTRGMKL